MTDLEKKKLETQHMKVKAARMELEISVLERLQDIERLNKNIEIQKQKEYELEVQLAG